MFRCMRGNHRLKAPTARASAGPEDLAHAQGSQAGLRRMNPAARPSHIVVEAEQLGALTAQDLKGPLRLKILKLLTGCRPGGLTRSAGFVCISWCMTHSKR